MYRKTFDGMNCSIARALDEVGEWWSLLIVRECTLGTTRFDEFQRRLGIARNVLTARLNKLVEHGVLDKVPAQGEEHRNEYRLTAKGEDLYPVLVALLQWGDRWCGHEPPVHLVDHKTGQPIEPVALRHGKRTLGLRDVRLEPGRGATNSNRSWHLRRRGAAGRGRAQGGRAVSRVPGHRRRAAGLRARRAEPTLPPDLVLALFVAPVLLDAAFDASLRDLRDNWAPLVSLVVFAVGLTTAAVAVVAHALVPGMPWAAAIALGAIVAPPDAVAATAVLRPLRPPQRILGILEGESLLNDASALLIYRLAVGAWRRAASRCKPWRRPSCSRCWAASWPARLLGWLCSAARPRAAHPTAIILQFVGTFTVWLVAEHAGLSGVLTTVCFAMTLARLAPARMPARIRIPTNAVWATVIFALNIFAFIFIGLQIRPILVELGRRARAVPARRGRRAGHGDPGARRLAHGLQRRAALAAPPHRLPSAAPHAAAHGGQRPGDLLGRHARHRHPGRGAGAARGLSRHAT
jgi:DNA-binding HxlR family transcriptional regulator